LAVSLRCLRSTVLHVPTNRSPRDVRGRVEGLLAAPAIRLLLSPFVDRGGSAVPHWSADLAAGRGWEWQRGLLGGNGLSQRPDCAASCKHPIRGFGETRVR
jgi:hypothetical protein